MDNYNYSYKLGVEGYSVEGYSTGPVPDTTSVPRKGWWIYTTTHDRLRVLFNVNWRSLYYADTINGKFSHAES